MILTALSVVSIALLALVVARPHIATGSHGGRAIAFLALLALPVIVSAMGFERHVEHSKTTAFCTSCHVMEPYGKSLLIDDAVHIPAGHYQNGRVPRDNACFTCHTTYTMYGDFNAKLRGLRHVYVQYLGAIPKKISLYSPYDNRECLHCHDGARSFEEATTHHGEPGRLAKIKANQLSCVAADCHGAVHDVAKLDQSTFWKEPVR
jgi:nitrate/TMAO reductase-like tetraheme cytochrome c subunit